MNYSSIKLTKVSKSRYSFLMSDKACFVFKDSRGKWTAYSYESPAKTFGNRTRMAAIVSLDIELFQRFVMNNGKEEVYLSGQRGTAASNVYHLMDEFSDYGTAICGKKAGRTSNGWFINMNTARELCPKCNKKIAHH